MTMDKKAFVLLSGGLDSTTCLALALRDYDNNVEAVSINYGQRHVKETEQARKICDYYGIHHSVLDLRGLLNGPMVMLTQADIAVPNISYDEITGVSPTYVPFRNGTMLAALTAHAQKYVMSQIDREVRDLYANTLAIGEDEAKEQATRSAKDLVGIYFGAHAEDAHNWAYPDCTPEFVGSMANAIYVGSYFTIRLHTPFVHSTKGHIVEVGSKLGVPYDLTWSCYKGQEYQCGVCPTCRARKAAFEAAEVTDPTIYIDMDSLPPLELNQDEVPF